MPAPSAEHSPILRQMSDELLKASPKASFFTWHVLEAGEVHGLDSPQVYVTAVHNDAGEWVGGEMLNGPENRIVAKYQKILGWSAREEGIRFAYSINEARETTDLEGTGTLDPDFEGRPGLESF
jgi:hypothetical protein